MAILISDDEFAEIRAVIQDVTDTFHQKTINYLMRGDSLDLHNEDRTDESFTSYALPGLVVWEKTSDDAKVKESSKGNLDTAEGYVNFNYDDCDAADLISDLKFIGSADEDLIEFDSVRYKILAIVPIGQFPTKNSIVRIIFRKLIKNGS